MGNNTFQPTQQPKKLVNCGVLFGKRFVSTGNTHLNIRCIIKLLSGLLWFGGRRQVIITVMFLPVPGAGWVSPLKVIFFSSVVSMSSEEAEMTT